MSTFLTQRPSSSSSSVNKSSSSSSSSTTVKQLHTHHLSSINHHRMMGIFDPTPFYQSTSIFLWINLSGFIISILSGGSHIHLDLLGTGAFALAVLIPTFITIPRLQTNTRIALSSICITVWSMKLAFFLFYRALQVKTDARLDETLNTLSGTFAFWFISFLWGLVCSLPHTLGSTSSSLGNVYSRSIGFIVFLLGWMTETRSDYQKWMFKQQHQGPSHMTSASFCNVGLWSISQHPNFFGNLLLWFGILIMNSDSLIETGGSPLLLSWKKTHNKTMPYLSLVTSLLWKARRLFLALLSPCFMYLLFHGQSSGYITNSVQLAIQKYGGKPDGLFEKYIQDTPLIFPRNIFGWLYQTLTLK